MLIVMPLRELYLCLEVVHSALLNSHRQDTPSLNCYIPTGLTMCPFYQLLSLGQGFHLQVSTGTTGKAQKHSLSSTEQHYVSLGLCALIQVSRTTNASWVTPLSEDPLCWGSTDMVTFNCLSDGCLGQPQL